jgi:L-threonylcarbamoyladenylate synthase
VSPVGQDGGVAYIFDCSDPLVREAAISTATRAVTNGQLVVMPTDTVYGSAADAFDPSAVAKLLGAKGRGRDMPLPVLVGSWDTIKGLVSTVSDTTQQLIEAFWPGGLTLVVEQAPSLAWDLGDARGTVAIRMPQHPVALELLAATGPLAVSSANISGQPPALIAADARSQFEEEVEVYLDGGPSMMGIASTIVDVTTHTPRILRVGAVTLEQLREVIPNVAS